MKFFLIPINPLHVFFWTFRRNEKDTVNLYTALSPVMQLATGGSMLNFGFWSEKNSDPISAQNNLCLYFAKFAELSSAKKVLDVGSGLSAPSTLWKTEFPNVNFHCININFQQLQKSEKKAYLEFCNSSATKLPFANNSVDRVLALESAQHFKPLSDFISEAKRILEKNGILALAIPVTNEKSSLGKLGILKFTWSSEHYDFSYLKDLIKSSGFEILQEELIGSNVYDPLADYYIDNREKIQKNILREYPQYVEKILFRSIKKMKESSREKIIDYALIKCIIRD